MTFADQPPSNHWTALKYRSEPFAEVWFRPEGEPYGITFRIPRGSFQVPDLGPLLTAENLLKAVGVAAAEVDSVGRDGAGDFGTRDFELRQPLSPPPRDAIHLIFHIRLKPPPEAAVPGGGTAAPDLSEANWQELEARWNTILKLEASLEMARIRMDALLADMEASLRRTLTTDEKIHGLGSDVAQWNKAKSRVLFALPKAKDFIHRATWAPGAPERKQLEEVFNHYIRPRVLFPGMDQLPGQLDNLLKDRQVLSALGVAAYQDCQDAAATVQGALMTLQSNAAASAIRKRATAKGKSS